MPKVSVIVPVYGVGKYIERCARSLFEQTLDDIEFLFIDDCTPDNSIAVLHKIIADYPNRYHQVKIHRMEKNSGQAKVREWGMKNAIGEYVIHCDSDDWIEPNMYERMYNYAVAERFDVVRCLFDRTNGYKFQKCKTVDQQVYSEKEILISKLLTDNDLSSTWDKLVSRTICQHSSFVYPQDNMCEDVAITMQYFCLCNKVGVINEIFYHYYLNETSISNWVNVEHIKRKAKEISNNIQLVNKLLDYYLPQLNYEQELVVMKLMAKDVYKPVINERGIYSLWKNVFNEINGQVLFSKLITFKQKLSYVFCYLKLYPFLKKIIRF